MGLCFVAGRDLCALGKLVLEATSLPKKLGLFG